MPSNDGTPRVWFSLLSVEADRIVIEHCPLDYDYATAAAKIRGARLPEEYAASLKTGLWSCCDVLPLKEIHDRGVALEPGNVFWSRPPQLEGKFLRKRSPVCTPRSGRCSKADGSKRVEGFEQSRKICSGGFVKNSERK
jgi:hypothetical protein